MSAERIGFGSRMTRPSKPRPCGRSPIRSRAHDFPRRVHDLLQHALEGVLREDRYAGRQQALEAAPHARPFAGALPGSSGLEGRLSPHAGFTLRSTPNGYAGTMRIRKILVAVDPALPHGGTLRTAVQLATAAEAQIAVPWRDPQGVPAVEIVRAADRERADLIVLPRDPRNTLEGTVQRARVPCLVVAPGGAGLGRVLAAIDGGPDSGDVLGAARAIGQLPGSEVLSVRVERWSGCATASLASAGELSGRWGETAGSGTTTLSALLPRRVT